MVARLSWVLVFRWLGIGRDGWFREAVARFCSSHPPPPISMRLLLMGAASKEKWISRLELAASALFLPHPLAKASQRKEEVQISLRDRERPERWGRFKSFCPTRVWYSLSWEKPSPIPTLPFLAV